MDSLLKKCPLTILCISLFLGSSNALSILPNTHHTTSSPTTSSSTSRRELLSTSLPKAILTSSSTAFLLLNTPTSTYAATTEYSKTDRGIQYTITKPPTDPSSPSPVRAQRVETYYTLYLNGFPDDSKSSTRIDSSKSPLGNKPFKFVAGVAQVIRGWDLTVLDMKVGEARRIVVPSDLGYGASGAGGRIPGGATLYFELELVSVGEVPVNAPEQLVWLEEHPL